MQPDVEEPTEVPDLMAALEASLAAAGGSKTSAGNGGAAKAKKPAAKKPAAKKPAAKKTAAKKPAPRAKRAKAGSRS